MLVLYRRLFESDAAVLQLHQQLFALFSEVLRLCPARFREPEFIAAYCDMLDVMQLNLYSSNQQHILQYVDLLSAHES